MVPKHFILESRDGDRGTLSVRWSGEQGIDCLVLAYRRISKKFLSSPFSVHGPLQSLFFDGKSCDPPKHDYRDHEYCWDYCQVSISFLRLLILLFSALFVCSIFFLLRDLGRGSVYLVSIRVGLFY